MKKSIIITLVLTSILSSGDLPKSNQLTDWSKVNIDKCLEVKSKIIKGFNEGVKFKKRQINNWNKYCHESTQLWIYTPVKCESMYNTLINANLTNIHKKTWNKVAQLWNRDCQEVIGKQLLEK